MEASNGEIRKREGNWKYVRLHNPDLDFEISVSNRRTQNYVTFINRYKDDIHLVKVVDYLIDRISFESLFEKSRKILASMGRI